MTAFEDIVIGKSSIPALIITVVLMLAIPVGCFLFWRGKHKAQTTLVWQFAGAAGFLVSARVLEFGVHYFCIVADNPVSRFLNGSTAAFVLYGVLTAGVFEECGRYLILKHILKKNRTPENAVFYGIGHGGIEILAVVLPLMVTYLAIAVLFSAGNTENALGVFKITEENAAAFLPSLQAAAAFDYAAMAMNVMERLFAMCLHIGLTVIVFYGVSNRKPVFLPLAIVLHMLMDTFPALFQRGVLPLWAVEVWAAVWAVVIGLASWTLYKKMKAPLEKEL